MNRSEHRVDWLRRIFREMRVTLLAAPQCIIRFFLDKFEPLASQRRLTVLWILGAATLTPVMWGCIVIGVNFAVAAFATLITIVFLSLFGSLIFSVLFSFAALLCLDFFFVEPLYALGVGSAQSLATLTAFLMTSLTITGLVRLVRSLSDKQSVQARLLDHGRTLEMPECNDSTKGSRIEEALRKRQVAIDVIPAFASIHGPDGRCEYVNEVGRAYRGLPLTDATGDQPWIAVHPDDEPGAEAAWRHCLANGTPFEAEMRFRLENGEYRWHLNRRAPHRDENGKILKWYGVAFDIENQKRAEAALRRSEAYLSEAQKLSRTGSFGWNTSNGELFWSEETFRIAGYDPTTKPSKKAVLDRVHPDDLSFVRNILGHAASNNKGFDFEHRLVMPDSTVKHLHVVAHFVQNEQGHSECIGALMDITSYKNAYSELECSEQRYRGLFNHLPVALWQLNSRNVVDLLGELRAKGVTDLESYFDANPGFFRRCMNALIVEEVNERTVQMFGSRDEIIGQSLARFYPDNSSSARRALESRFRGDTHFEEETEMIALDGRQLDVLFTTTRVGSIDNGVSLQGVIDISERNRAQRELQQVQHEFAHAARVAMLGELAASIAHEVNQPLAAISANGEVGLRWLRQSEPNLQELRELTASIVSDAQRAANIVRRIRAMAAGRPPERTVLVLDEVIGDALLFLRHELQSRGISITHHIAPSVHKILSDRTQLQQVIANIVVNAIQAMAGSTNNTRNITIRTENADMFVCCMIEDSGPGIKPEHLGRIFENFFTTKDMGMGMGLRICRSIIEEHGGRIMADSECGNGRGARFTFTLPAAHHSR